MAANRKRQVSFWQGWNLALESVWEALAAMPGDSFTPDQEGLRAGIFDWLRQHSPDEDLLTVKPTNAELAEKYAVSLRTVTNWRKEGCPFEDGQWRVLDWMVDRRYAPARAKTKFARQLGRRTGECLDEITLLDRQAKDLARIARAWRL